MRAGATTTITHDGKDHLTDATGGREEEYAYDPNGNRDMDGYSIGTTNDGVYTYSYDKEGNITKRSKGPTDETWFYGYDHLNHMTWAELRAEDDDQSALLMRADYEYDALGRRIEKAVDADGDGGGGTTTTRFSYLSKPYADIPILWADLDGSSSLTTRYLRGDAVDQIFARIGSGTPAWLLQNHIGSIRNVVNNSGTILATVVNDSFGNQITAEDADTGRFRFASMQWDAEIGTSYTFGRIFGPDFGGWYSEDPYRIEFVDGPNLRVYVNNNPLVSTDPTGALLIVPKGAGEAWRKKYLEEHSVDMEILHGLPDGREILYPKPHSKKLLDSLFADELHRIRVDRTKQGKGPPHTRRDYSDLYWRVYAPVTIGPHLIGESEPLLALSPGHPISTPLIITLRCRLLHAMILHGSGNRPSNATRIPMVISPLTALCRRQLAITKYGRRWRGVVLTMWRFEQNGMLDYETYTKKEKLRLRARRRKW